MASNNAVSPPSEIFSMPWVSEAVSPVKSCVTETLSLNPATNAVRIAFNDFRHKLFGRMLFEGKAMGDRITAVNQQSKTQRELRLGYELKNLGRRFVVVPNVDIGQGKVVYGPAVMTDREEECSLINSLMDREYPVPAYESGGSIRFLDAGRIVWRRLS